MKVHNMQKRQAERKDNMKVNVYTLHVEYEGLESKVWRDIEVSGNYLLNRLGYVILATFDTMAYHLFDFDINGKKYIIPDEEFDVDVDFDMAWFKLYQFKFNIGDTFTMNYDFGTMQTFIFTVTQIRPLEKGQGKAYPKVVAGSGCGIIDDMSAHELHELILQIKKNGKTDEDIYYKDRRYPWDFRPYDMKSDNALLKGSVDYIEEGYYPFWEAFWEDYEE